MLHRGEMELQKTVNTTESMIAALFLAMKRQNYADNSRSFQNNKITAKVDDLEGQKANRNNQQEQA